MAINPAAATGIFTGQQDLAPKLNAAVPVAAPVQAQGFTPAPTQAAPVNLGGGQQDLQSMVASVVSALTQVVQLLGAVTGKGAPAQAQATAAPATATPNAATAAPNAATAAPNAATATPNAATAAPKAPAGAPKPAAQAAAPAQKGQLNLTPDEVAAIKAAPTQEAAAQIVKQAMARQSGGNGNAQAIINGCLGSTIKKGRKKNKASAKFLDKMTSDVAAKVRAGQTTPTGGSSAALATKSPSSNLSGSNSSPSGSSSGTPFASGTPFSDSPSSSSAPNSSSGPLSSGPQTVDLAPFKPQADRIGEMGSPLIFDLGGHGHIIRDAAMVPVDIDGDGRVEVVSDLADGTGLLVFDPKLEGEGEHALGAEMFGSGTDLSAYGIEAKTDDGTFDNGFDALRAVAERFNLVRGDKQHLDANDLAFLESAIGLKMRVGGLYGEDVRLADLAISQIALGSPGLVQSLQHAMADAFGNKYLRQGGALFTICGERREYVDIFFRIQSRAAQDKPIAAAA